MTFQVLSWLFTFKLPQLNKVRIQFLSFTSQAPRAHGFRAATGVREVWTFPSSQRVLLDSMCLDQWSQM